MQFVDIVASEIFVGNPFINNPHLMYIEPYKTIYNRDKDKTKRKSSDEIYAIFCMVSPDEKENLWMKFSEEKRKEIIASNVKINWEDKIIKEALIDFPINCIGVAGKTLKAIQDKLIERDKFLKACPYLEDVYMRDDEGKMISRGNSFAKIEMTPDKIDKMISNSAALYKELYECQKLFAIEKDNISIRGQRRATSLEDGSLFADYDSR